MPPHRQAQSAVWSHSGLGVGRIDPKDVERLLTLSDRRRTHEGPATSDDNHGTGGVSNQLDPFVRD